MKKQFKWHEEKMQIIYFCKVLKEVSLGREKFHVIASEFLDCCYHGMSCLISTLTC